jgi:hypothetical protein
MIEVEQSDHIRIKPRKVKEIKISDYETGTPFLFRGNVTFGKISTMTKAELISQLTNAKNNYILGLAALALFASEEAYPIIEKSSCSFGTYSLSFDQVARLLRKQEDKEIAVKEFMNMLLRTLIKESFELIKTHCNASKQTPALSKQQWYQFARMIRNCLSHNFKFEFNRYDKGLLPVTWRGKTITAGMDGSFLELSFFGYVEAWVLFNEMYSFAVDALT